MFISCYKNGRSNIDSIMQLDCMLASQTMQHKHKKLKQAYRYAGYFCALALSGSTIFIGHETERDEPRSKHLSMA